MDIRYTGIVIVIPTRNRPQMAINAICSVLRWSNPDVSVVVSDNSTSSKESEKLKDFCNNIDDSRLRYIAPSKPLSMWDHWEWAVQEALKCYDSSHFTLLTDRCVFISDGLMEIARQCAARPDKVITYCTDSIYDSDNPVKLFQHDWTGEIFEIEASHLLDLASRVKISVCHPRMTNCIVPRSVFLKIQEGFGDVFKSLSPDYCFGFRCLEIVDSILYSDRATSLSYGTSVSSNWGCATGIVSEAYADIVRELGGTLLFWAAPIPELIIGANAKVHEYCLVKRQANSEKFPELNVGEYLKEMGKALELIRDPDFKGSMSRLLEVHGWLPLNNSIENSFTGECGYLQTVGKLNHRFRIHLRDPRMRKVWLLSSRLFGIYPSGVTLEFESSEEAIHHAERFPRRKRFKFDHLMQDLELETLKHL